MALHGLCLLLDYLSMNIQMKATEKYFLVVLFITLYKMVLTFESENKILKCDHSNESYWAVLSCGTYIFIILIKVVLSFESVDEILRCEHSNEESEQYFSFGPSWVMLPALRLKQYSW